MECFVIIVNGWKSLTIITKHSILDVAAVLDPPLFFKPDVAELDPRTAYNSDIKNFDESYFSITWKKHILICQQFVQMKIFEFMKMKIFTVLSSDLHGQYHSK